MKASTVIAAAAVLTGSIVSAQLDQIPQCALTCAITSLGSTGCGSTDIKCICQASGFVSALTPCVQSACSAADLQKTITAAEGLCASAGVSLSIPPISGSSTAAAAASTSAAASSAVATTSSAEVSTTTKAVSTLTTAVSSVYVVPSSNATVTHSTVVVPTANSTVTTGKPSASTSSLPSATPSGSAAGRNAVALGGLGAVLAFAVALL